MKIRVGTFNLFQFVEPPYCWYTKHERFKQEEWEEKISWIKNQIKDMNCDVIGFQEVFSKNALKNLLKECGFKYFETIDDAKVDSKNEFIYTSTTVALASKFPINNLKKVKPNYGVTKKHHLNAHFKFAREPIKSSITLCENKEINLYVCHLKSNRENEFEYIFTKDTSFEEKIGKVSKALEDGYSQSLKQRLCEASSLYSDIKKENNPTILMTDLNDREFSLTIDALTNNRYHNQRLKKDSFLLLDAYHLHKVKVYNPHPESKGVVRTPTSYFAGKGNVLDYIFVSNDFDKKNPNKIGQVTSYEIFNKHLLKNQNGSLLNSDHAQVVCEIEIFK